MDDQGENSIIIIAGTNGLVSKEMIEEDRHLIEESDIVIMQLEIPLEVVEYVKELAIELGKLVIVDPAPAVEGSRIISGKGLTSSNRMRQNLRS